MNPILTLILALIPRPGAPGDRAPDRDWDLQHLHLDLRLLPDSGRIEGSATLRVAPLSPPDPLLRLDQLGLDVQGVTVGGAPVPWTRTDTELLVRLDPAKGAQELRVAYAAQPQEGLYFRRPGPDSPDVYPEIWTQGEAIDNRHWIPLPDHPGDRFTSSGRFEAPKGWRVLSNGLGQQEGDVWTYRMDQPLVSYLVALAAGPYEVVTLSGWNGVKVEQWVDPAADRVRLGDIGAKLPRMLEYFSEVTGTPYAYPSYREVYVQRYLFGAMENTTATIMARNLLGTPGAPSIGEHLEEVSAHEAAHHWFGDLVTCRHWTELWLNEGFAWFYGWEWVRHSLGDATWARNHVNAMEHASRTGVLSGRFWSTADGSHGPSSGVYVKGSAVLHALRALLGEDTFRQGIQRYLQVNRDQLVDTEDLRRAFEEVTGDDLRWFFDQWVHWPSPPVVKANGRYERGEYTLRLTQELAAGQAPYTLHLDLELGGPTPQRRRVWVDQESVVLVLPLNQAPSYVAIDPEGALPIQVEFEQQTAAWTAQLGSAAPVARVRALRALRALPPEPATSEAVLALLNDPDPEWGEEAAYTLGDWGSPEAQEALRLCALDSARALGLRIACADALSRRPAGPEGVAALRKLLSAPEQRLRATALRSLRPLDRTTATETARKALRSPRGAAPVWLSAALDVLGQDGTPEDLTLVLGFVRGSVHEDMLFASASAAVRLAQRSTPSERPSARAQVARALEPLLRSADLRVRRVVLGQLAEVGDESTQRLLEAWKLTQHEPDVRDNVDNTLKQIRERGPDTPVEEALGQAKILELEKRLNALEKELEAMEERR